MIINGNHFDSPIIINDVKTKKRIIDGQHRISAIRQILESNPEFRVEVLLVVYQDLTNDLEKEVFTRWNSGTRQTGEDILQIYTNEIPIYDLLKEKMCIYYEMGKIKFRNIVQPYLYAKNELNPLNSMNPHQFIDYAKKLNKTDANEINSFLEDYFKNTKSDIVFKKAAGQFALVYTFVTMNRKDFWKKFNKIKRYKVVMESGEQQGRVAMTKLIHVMKNKMFGVPMPVSPLTLQEIFSEEKVNWLRKNYEKTTWDIGDITQEFNEKYRLNIPDKTVGYYLKKHGIKKLDGYQARKGLVFTKNVIDFMKECSKKMTITEARRACELKFEHEFNAGFGQRAKKEGIVFCHSKNETILNANPKQKEIIKKYKKLNALEIRDKIIEETGVNIKVEIISEELRRLREVKPLTEKEITKKLKEAHAYDPEEDGEEGDLPDEFEGDEESDE